MSHPASATTTTPGALVATSLADRALARLSSATRAGFYGAAAHSMLRVGFPSMKLDRTGLRRAMQDSYDLHMKVLERPGMREVMARVEREDLATLPVFAAMIPFDVVRVLRKQFGGVEKLPVAPSDDFPYPEYYLNDFHNQANGNLSYRAALTYEWQIRFLFMGTNRLMRQGVVDEVPEGAHLDVLDVACGTGSWITQARLQNRGHHVTGIDLSPQYLRVAKTLRKKATFLQMNAEHMRPEWTGRFDLATCIWLFHELPLEASERVTAEIARVLKPGGRLVFMDAAQAQDMPDRPVDRSNNNFRSYFNEPYFMLYQTLDLPALFARHGLAVEKTERWYASKVMTLRKDA